MMKRIYLFGLLLYPVFIWSQSPGGIHEITAWLKADLKNNYSLFSKVKVDAATDKIYPNVSLLNYNPAFQFNGLNDHIYFPIQANELSQATIFVVYQEAEAKVEQSVWKLNGISTSISLTTKMVSDVTGDLTYAADQPNSAVINTYIKNWKTEKIEDHEGLFLGKNESGAASFNGKIAEYLLYDKVLKRSAQRKIETYLAIKYGISLKHDYISSSGKLLWSFKNNSAYSYRITGLGRDDKGSLYQRQSENKEESFFIAIGAGEIANSNNENKNNINELDFLLFGDNDEELIIENAGENDELIRLLKRRWFMNVSGKSANTLSTELRIDISKIFPERSTPNNYVLLIDRSGKGNFTSDKTEYFIANELSKDGILTFKDIFWDTDCSGTDIFSFGLKPAIRLTGLPEQIDRGITLYPNPSSNGNYTLSIRLEKPTAIQVNIFDEGGRLVQSLSGNQRSQYLFNGKISGSAGVYSFHITTPYQKTTKQLVVR